MQKPTGIRPSRVFLSFVKKDTNGIARGLFACMKRQAFTELAKQTDDIKLQAKYLEYALTFVMAENISVLEKGENILKICARLLHIYKHTKSGKHYRRIKELEQNTRELLQ